MSPVTFDAVRLKIKVIESIFPPGIAAPKQIRQ